MNLRNPSGSLCVAASAVLAAALPFAAACSRPQPVQAKQDSGPIKVRVAPVTTKHIQRVVESVGTLFPYDESTISAEIEGRIEDIRVDLGDQVTKGQVLVKISDEEQKYLLAQNEAQLRMSLERLGLKGENERISDVRETSEVRRAQADLFDAEQHYNRVKNLAKSGVTSKADLDQAQARFNAAKANYDMAINQTGNLAQEISRSKASLDLQRKKLRDTTVFAPFSARVKERLVAPGSYVRPNTPLLTLVKIDPIRLRIEVPERMAPWIRGGQTAEVTLEAYSDRTFRGRVWRISPTVDQAKRTFVVEALIDNPTGDLKPGSYARAKLPTNRTDSIKLIPARAVNYVFGSNKAYVVKSGVIEAREVKVGDRFDQDIEIVSGVDEGESVAISQLNKLDTGTKVAVIEGERKLAEKRAD
jgi:RND family efflux transporter MFP subunit